MSGRMESSSTALKAGGKEYLAHGFVPGAFGLNLGVTGARGSGA